MAGESIIRNPTADEKMDFTPVADKRGRIKSPKAKFTAVLVKEEAKARTKLLPFASHAARDDYNDELDRQVKKSIRKNGYADPNDIKLPKIDWSIYSDVKNFELVGEGNKPDEHLSKRHNKPISIKWKKYQYKGYSNTYRVMEDPFDAIKRS